MGYAATKHPGGMKMDMETTGTYLAALQAKGLTQQDAAER